MNTKESKQVDSPAQSRNSLGRVAGIGVLLAMIAGLFLFAGGWLSPHALTATAIVDTFERLNGPHPGFRRNHAKGVCVTGFFESNGQAQYLSRSQVFRPGRVPIVGRFALADGHPYVADSPGTVRSLAVQFKQPDGEEWRTAMINIPVFPVHTPQEFAEFLFVSSPDPATGKVNSTAMGSFLAMHPETASALKVIGGRPSTRGFVDSPYYALNTFLFVNDRGQSTPVRWHFTPDQSAETNSSETGQNYLFNALIQEIHAGPLRWHLMITVGRPQDPTADASLQWPPDRKEVDAGTLTLNSIESDDSSPTRDLTFDPLVLPDGIGPSDDPLLSARSAAYSVSLRRRDSERKSPSAVSAAEVQR